MTSLPSQRPEFELNGAITAALADFSRRRIRLLALRACAAGLIALIATMTVVTIFDYLWVLPDSARWSLSLIAYGMTVAVALRFGWRRSDQRDLRRIAMQLESADPRFQEQLLSTVELADRSSANGSPQFRNALQDQTGRRLATVEIGDLLPVALIRPWLWTAVMILFAVSVLFVVPKMQFGRRIARAMLPAAAIQRASITKIHITEPSPPSGPVAVGDAIGIVASIDQPGTDAPQLEWRDATGPIERRTMSRRSGTSLHAAIIALGDVPIEYRILAGDAVTLWYRLTPVPRPQIESFSITYQFPEYAGIPNQTIVQEHGDLRAVRGTVANVTVHFSEPCTHASLQFIGRGINGSGEQVDLTATNELQTTFSVDVPIDHPSQYQVLATGLNSGLRNPQVHPASIIPLNDAPPVIDWDEQLPRQSIASKTDVVKLQANVHDEFPIDTLTQEYQVNGGPVVVRPLPPVTANIHEVAWGWDLLDQESQFTSGDVIHTTLVAIDRLGQRGESSKLELLLSDDGFAADRYKEADRLHAAAREIIAWTQAASDQMKSAADSLRDEQDFADDLPPTDPISVLIDQVITSAKSTTVADRAELTMQAIEDLKRRIDDWDDRRERFTANGEPVDRDRSDPPEPSVDQLRTEALRCASDARRIESYIRNQLSERVSLGLIDDATALMKSLRKIIDADMDLDRNTRHLRIADGRLTEMDETFAKYQDSLSDHFRSQFENWSRFRLRQHEILIREIDQPESLASQQHAIEALEHELASGYSDREIFSRQVSIGLIDSRIDLNRQIVPIGEATGHLSTATQSIDQIRQKVTTVDDSARVAQWNDQLRFANERLSDRSVDLVRTVQQVRDLHNRHPHVDLAFIADLGLMRRAIERLNDDSTKDLDSGAVAITSAYGDLADAFQILQAGHDLGMAKRDLRTLVASEFEIRDDADFRFSNPQRFEEYIAGIDWPCRRLNQSSIPTESLRRSVHPEPANQIRRAKQLLGQRRDDRRQLVSVQTQLRMVEAELDDYLNELQPAMQAARNRLRRYATSLDHLARQAAEKVRTAIESTESDNGSHEELAQRQQTADLATKQTMESLADLANTLSSADRESRELARDADSALAQIGHHRDRVNDAMKSGESLADLADELEKLRQRLDQTADHFEQANRGADLTESRNQIRQAEQSLDLQESLDERAQRAAELAEAAERDAEELRKQLADAAEKSETMRDAMSEIAKQNVRSALASLQQSASDERSLGQHLERSDPELAEQNQRWTDHLKRLGDQMYSVDRILGTTLSRMASDVGIGDDSDRLARARESIRTAARTAEDQLIEGNLRATITDVAREMSIATGAARESMEAFQAAIEQTLSSSTASQPTIEQRDAQRQLRNVRDQMIRAENDLKRAWTKVKQHSNQRVDQAKDQRQSNESAQQQLEESSNRVTDAIGEQISDIEQRINQSHQAEQAARDSVAEAKLQIDRSNQRIDDLRKEIIEPFHSDRPVAEATGRLAAKATEQLNRIAGELDQIIEHSASGESLNVPEFATQFLQARQSLIRDEIDQTGNGLRRAALNEQRLGRNDSAQKIADAATRVKRIAASTATDAIRDLQQAQENTASALTALRRVAEVEQQLTAEVDQLTRLLGEMPGASADSHPNDPRDPRDPPGETDDDRARQMAQTLDELDQATNQEGDIDQSAGEVSATMQQALEQAAREAAQERQKQIGAGADEPQVPTDDDDSNAAGDNPFGGTPGGDSPDAGSVSIDEVDRQGAEWGFLRSRRGDDQSEIQRAQIPARYRRQIEAYFRAVAERSAGTER